MKYLPKILIYLSGFMLISEVPTFGRCFKNDCDFGKEILIKKNYNYQFLEKNIKVDKFIAKLISEKNVNNQSAGSNVEIESDIISMHFRSLTFEYFWLLITKLCE